MSVLCSIAGFTVKINNRFGRLERQCADYAVSSGEPDYVIDISDADLLDERRRAETEGQSDGYLESLAAYRKLCSALPYSGAFLLHGSVIDSAGRGIAFLAPSGIGKTTHTLLWKAEYPSDVTVINGDKPIVRLIDGLPYAYGTPWAGKERLQTNARVCLTDICFIERGRVNSAFEISAAEAAPMLMRQIYVPSDAGAAAEVLSLADALLKRCRRFVIRCNTDPQAARAAHEAIFGGN